MSRPLTIGERQKLRTAEERRASRAKGTETRRKNKLSANAAREMNQGDLTAFYKRVPDPEFGWRFTPDYNNSPPTLWSRFLAWWRT